MWRGGQRKGWGWREGSGQGHGQGYSIRDPQQSVYKEVSDVKSPSQINVKHGIQLKACFYTLPPKLASLADQKLFKSLDSDLSEITCPDNMPDKLLKPCDNC